jgi:hypothetical protein
MGSAVKNRNLFLRTQLDPRRMPASKTISPARQAELERRTADWERRQAVKPSK